MAEASEDHVTPGLSGDLAVVAQVLQEASVAVGLLDVDGTVRYTNESFARTCGRPGGELLGAQLADSVVADDRVGVHSLLDAMSGGAGPGSDGASTSGAVDVRFVGADGRVRAARLDMALLTGELATALSPTDRPDEPDGADETEPGASTLVMCIATDRSTERRTERSARRQRVAETTAAMTDPVTGLLNNRGMELTLESAARRSGRHETAFAYIHCTIERSPPEDSAALSGHTAGADVDESLLLACVERIRQRLRPSDTVARSGDAVVVVAEDLADEQDAAGVTYRILSTVIEPVRTDDEPVAVRMRAATVVADGTTPVHKLAPAAAEAVSRAVEDKGFELVDLRR